jgi:hypothetical protein
MMPEPKTLELLDVHISTQFSRKKTFASHKLSEWILMVDTDDVSLSIKDEIQMTLCSSRWVVACRWWSESFYESTHYLRWTCAMIKSSGFYADRSLTEDKMVREISNGKLPAKVKSSQYLRSDDTIYRKLNRYATWQAVILNKITGRLVATLW